MVKTTKFYVEVKKSKNFQAYTCGEEIYLEDGDDEELARDQAMARCRKTVMNQISLG